jgi:WD40 repeat protein
VAVFFSADGKSISGQCGDSHIRTWDVASGKLMSDKEVPRRSALLSADLYAERDRNAGTLRVWDLSAQRQLQLINGAPMGETAVSSDRRLIASASADERSIRIWNLATGEQRHSLPDGVGGAASLVFSPDGETVVSANYDNDIRVWKTKSGELVRRVEDMTGAMFAAEFTPDGKHLIMGGLDETVYIWDAKTFALLRKLKGHGETIASLAISPDGRTLVTGGFDVFTEKNPVKVAIWDLASGTITRTIRAPHVAASVAFSPDSKWIALAAGEKEVELWKVAGGKE